MGLSEPFSRYKKVIYKQQSCLANYGLPNIQKSISRPYFGMISIPNRLKNSPGLWNPQKKPEEGPHDCPSNSCSAQFRLGFQGAKPPGNAGGFVDPPGPQMLSARNHFYHLLPSTPHPPTEKFTYGGLLVKKKIRESDFSVFVHLDSEFGFPKIDI